ncbi:MAG: biopolymer transporter ExbD [Granulosicoccaceae bacterium]|jgi:biopolymer transport protein ExbD
MNLSQHRNEEPDINLTPLIDVVFLLLIFFMVSTTFNKESELSIELPEASGEARQAENTPIEIAISRDGQYSVNGEQLARNDIVTLKRAIKQIAGNRDNPPLVIIADGKTTHQSVVTAMDAVRQLDITHITFATKTPAEDN